MWCAFPIAAVKNSAGYGYSRIEAPPLLTSTCSLRKGVALICTCYPTKCTTIRARAVNNRCKTLTHLRFLQFSKPVHFSKNLYAKFWQNIIVLEKLQMNYLQRCTVSHRDIFLTKHIMKKKKNFICPCGHASISPFVKFL